jgi:hypothetical protein
MSSIAQQANPNNKYHCEDARPQFNSSSTLAVKAVSGNRFTNGMNLPIHTQCNAYASIVTTGFVLISVRYVSEDKGFRLGLAGISLREKKFSYYRHRYVTHRFELKKTNYLRRVLGGIHLLADFVLSRSGADVDVTN